MPPEGRAGRTPQAARATRVGALVLAALLTLAVGVFLIGERNNLFRRSNPYTIHFARVAGLQSGNPVQLDGVEVGEVEAVLLPQRPGERLLEVEISVDQRYQRLIRKDSRARIKTLGLLGDKYIELTSGSEEAVVIPPRGEIEAAEPTDVDRLIATGEDVVDNIVAISASLLDLLRRVEHGEGVLGELMSEEAKAGRSVTESLFNTLDTVERLSGSLERRLEEGRGPLYRLLDDRELGDRLASSVARLDRVLEAVEEGDGPVPALLHDAEMTAQLRRSLDQLEASSGRLSELTRELQEGDGLLPRLIHDEEYGRETLEELRQLLERLDATVAQITEGDGTVARLIQDPEVYQALNDVIVGVNESKLLRWLIRNRQKAGIRERYRDAQRGETPSNESQQDGSPHDETQPPD